MKIWNQLQSNLIFLNISLSNKDEIIQFIANAFSEVAHIQEPEKLYTSFKEREKIMSTGIGNGIGIPHAFSPEVKDAKILFMKLKKAVDFQAVDSKPVDTIVAIMCPENRTENHVQILAGIARLLRNPKFLLLFRKCTTPEQLLKGIYEIEEEMSL